MKRGLCSAVCCREAESRIEIVNSSMWPIPLTAIGHLLLMKNLWSEGGAAVTPNVMFSLFQHNHKPCPQHLLDDGFDLAFNVPCASVSDPHMQARG